MTDKELWTRAYFTQIDRGQSHKYAVQMADLALSAYKERAKEFAQ